MVELYHAEPVANSMKVLLCLKEKALPFVSHYVDLLRFEQHRPEFVAINPNGQVPVLVHDGAVINESTVINEYLDEVFPAVALRPADPAARARIDARNRLHQRLRTTTIYVTHDQAEAYAAEAFLDAEAANREKDQTQGHAAPTI